MLVETPSKKGVYKGILLLLVSSLLLLGASLSSTPKSYAHFGHLAHYNTGGVGMGKYYINEQIDPEYTRSGQPSKISFSIQDTNGNDVYNIVTMVEIYSESTGERVNAYPWTKQDTGDFDLYYVFPRVGLYEIVISIADGANSNRVNLYGVDPPRSILSSNLNCNCDRAVFNMSVSDNFGNIFNSAVFVGIISAIVVFGVVLVFTYRNRAKLRSGGSNLYQNLTKNEVIKYSVLLLAISSGIVHLAVYSEHGSLRIEYSIFLLTAGATQIAYSMLYILLTITDQSSTGQSREFAKLYYRKSVIVNLFGLVGSSVLLGLYAYSVTFPPPLSPNNVPEDIDFGGILDKALELALVIGIVYLMRSEKRNLQSQLVQIK
jgi:heme/copper-type cytochrome/quinol oxidase subunit 3